MRRTGPVRVWQQRPGLLVRLRTRPQLVGSSFRVCVGSLDQYPSVSISKLGVPSLTALRPDRILDSRFRKMMEEESARGVGRRFESSGKGVCHETVLTEARAATTRWHPSLDRPAA
jgi:hypothetical protein